MILGHKKQREILKKIALSGNPSHAYLFSGQEKLGKKKIAFEFLSLLSGKNLEKGSHPDFIFIEPIEGEIKISQIRELSWRLSLKNFVVPFKTVIIDNAHLMNIPSQNSFLKTLEEPKGRAVLILITHQPNFLLPTIISRCQTIKFYPVNTVEIENYLIFKKFSKEKAKEIAEISLGRPGLAIELSESKKFSDYQQAISILVKISQASLFSRFQYAKEIAENPKEILEIWFMFMRKILISKINNKEEKYFKNFSLLKMKKILNLIQEIIFLITTKNINQRLALENLMLEF